MEHSPAVPTPGRPTRTPDRPAPATPSPDHAGGSRARSDMPTPGTQDGSGHAEPAALTEIVEEFRAVPPAQRLELLMEFGADLPDPPEPYRSEPGLMERVTECQSPVHVLVRRSADRVRLVLSVAPSAPTTRGFAGVLHAGLDGALRDEVLAVGTDLPARLGLGDAVSPLRLAGMAGLLGRIQRQAREAQG